MHHVHVPNGMWYSLLKELSRASSSNRLREVACERLGISISQLHALEEVREQISNEYVLHTSGSKMGNHFTPQEHALDVSSGGILKED